MEKFHRIFLVFVFFWAADGLVYPGVAVSSEPLSVKDSTGHSITLPRVPRRIACLYAFCGHVVTMLDRGNDMVAIVNGLKKDLLLQQLVPGIQQIPVPANGGVIHIESLLKTEPDIVFLKPETAAISSEIKKLDQFLLHWFVAGYRNMEEQMTIIEQMGKVLGRHEKALAYTRFYREVIKRVSTRAAQIPADKKIRVYHSVNEARRTDAPGTIEADWTKAAGIINVSLTTSLNAKGDKRFADIEQILIWNPDVIIVNEDGVDQQILTDEKWSPIRAVQEKKVFPIPVGISRWGHPGGLETPLAILWTAKTVYPEFFKDLDLQKEISQFYQVFFNLTLDNGMINRILANKGMRHAFVQ